MNRRTAARLARGYTAVEVMMGLTLLAVGAAAVISMQRAAIQGNADARKLDLATAIAREWTDRLRRDAMLWTTPSPASSNSNYGSTKLLSKYLPAGTTALQAGWVLPDALVNGAASPDGVSPGFDILGRDLGGTDLHGDSTNNIPTRVTFCVNIRLNWIVTNQLIRAEVRVFWPRTSILDPNTNGPVIDWCNTTNATTVTNDTADYHFLYVTTAIRQNVMPTP
jgi:prepilin-type N-terminal cleavage/methylation domain-containing protein